MKWREEEEGEGQKRSTSSHIISLVKIGLGSFCTSTALVNDMGVIVCGDGR